MIRPLSGFLTMLTTLALLTSCAGDFGTALPEDEDKAAQQSNNNLTPHQMAVNEALILYPENKPPMVSLLDLGRAVSDGQVDIYDPWVSLFNVSPPAFTQPDALASFPRMTSHVLLEKDVKVYSMGMDIQDLPLQEPMALVEPQPLTDNDKGLKP